MASGRHRADETAPEADGFLERRAVRMLCELGNVLWRVGAAAFEFPRCSHILAAPCIFKNMMRGDPKAVTLTGNKKRRRMEECVKNFINDVMRRFGDASRIRFTKNATSKNFQKKVPLARTHWPFYYYILFVKIENIGIK